MLPKNLFSNIFYTDRYHLAAVVVVVYFFCIVHGCLSNFVLNYNNIIIVNNIAQRNFSSKRFC